MLLKRNLIRTLYLDMYQRQKASEMLLKMELFCAFDANET